MDSSFAFLTIVILTMLIGSANIFIPFSSKKHYSRTKLSAMIITSFFYLLSIVVLGALYLHNGIISVDVLQIGHFTIKFHLEALGIIFSLLLAILWPIAIIYTNMYLKHSNHNSPKTIFSFITLCMITSNLIALSANLITMFIFYELLTIFTLPLVFNGHFADLNKYLKPLLYSSLLSFLPAILYINHLAGSTDFSYHGLIHPEPLVGIILFLLCLFGIAKAAIIPLHTWLPAAMVAIFPVSAILHAVAVVKVGLFCIFKIALYTFGIEYLREIFGDYHLILIIPGISIIYSGIKALQSDRLKLILAFSTINQLSTAVFAALLFSKAGLNAAIMQLLAHSTAKLTAFFAAGYIYLLTKRDKLTEIYSLYYQMPITTVILSISLLSLCGFPLLGGGVSKSYLMQALYIEQSTLAWVIFAASTILTLSYCGKVIYMLFQKQEYKMQKIHENKKHLIPTIMALGTIFIFPILHNIVKKILDFIQ
jgi:multicomponent Na+:H+ antiporter subunit D